MSQPPPSNSRIASIQVLRGLAAVMVVFYHLMFSEQLMSAPEDCLLSPLLKTGAAGVDLFFVISGFIMVTVTRKKFGAPGAVPEFLYSRFSRVYPVYWLFTLAILALAAVKPSLLNIPIGAPLKILQSFLLYPQEHFPILKVGWTLVHEIYFYLVFTVFLFWPARILPRGLALWAAAILAASALLWTRPPAPAGLPDIVINPLTFEFIMGCLIAIFLQKPTSLPGWIPLVAGLAGLICASSVSHHIVSFLADLRENWFRVAVYGIPSAFILYGAVALEKKQGKVFLSWLQPLGDASYSLYLVHLFVLSAMVKFWSFVPWQGPFIKVAYLAAMVAAAVVSGLLIHHFVEKPLLDFTHSARNRLFPGKSRAPALP